MASSSSARSSISSGPPKIFFNDDWTVSAILYSDLEDHAGDFGHQSAHGQRLDSLASTLARLDDDAEKQSSGRKKGGQPEEEQEKDPNLIDWEENDPENPYNWGQKKRWFYTASLGFMTFVVTFASSAFSAATIVTSKEFGVSTEVMTLGTSLFVLGFAFGPIAWGPASEVFGRKSPLYFGYSVFAMFNIPVGVAQNLYTIMICRFFAGFFASAPLAVIAGHIADMWDPVNRGIAICVFSAATFIGPITGPIIGGFTVMNQDLGWRWTQWFTLILAAFFGSIACFFVPETYAPVLLQRRAKKLRFQTKNWALHSQLDMTEVNLHEITHKYLIRPFVMMALEPVLLCITVYMSFIYGLIYMLFESFPVTWEQERGYNLGVGALPFLAILIGVLCGVSIIIFHSKTRYQRRLKQEGSVPAEERLVCMMIGGISLPIGLLWFAWTSFPTISPWPQIISCVPIGMGLQLVFLQGFNYIIDTYLMYSNSAISANTFVRSWVGAGLPLVVEGLYSNLGVRWATSLLGFIAIGLAPIPFLFYIYGPKLRKLSKYSPTL